MQRLSSPRPACGLLVGLVLIAVPPMARAAEAERVKFDTFDQVEIRGTFYGSDKGNRAPCAMLLHALGSSSDQEGWADLAKKLQAKGFAVLVFDFRGHGESTNVGPGFWLERQNQTLKSYRSGGKPREQISYKDFSTLASWGMCANDIAAAKRFLDRKNDSGDCNSANVCLIGAESGATLGALWTWAEWNRRRVTVGFPVVTGSRNQVEGQDILCAVWLSISANLGVGSKHTVSVDNWLRSPVREKMPMYFLFGEQDSHAASFAKHLCDKVLRAEKDPKMKLTGKMPIKDTKLSGRELLGKPSLNTDDLIIKYVIKVVEDRGINPYAKKDADRTVLVRVPVEYYLR